MVELPVIPKPNFPINLVSDSETEPEPEEEQHPAQEAHVEDDVEEDPLADNAEALENAEDRDSECEIIGEGNN